MNILFFLQYGSITDYLYRDLLELPSTEVYYVDKPYNGWKGTLQRIHHSHSLEKYIKLPGRSCWLDRKQIQEKLKADSVFLFDNGALSYMDMGCLNYLKKRYGKKMIAVVLDSVHAHSQNIYYSFDLLRGFAWDAVFSYDVNDCREFGFSELGMTYYSKCLNPSYYQPQSDIYYIGKQKKGALREQLIEDIYRRARDAGVKCDFSVVGSVAECVEGIHYLEKGISYSRILEELQNTSCILEVVQEGQKQQSVRYFEAVCYNKKLLTNNPSARKLPYFEKGFIRCFEKAEDIDYDWLRDKEVVDYKYSGEFSPIFLQERIQEVINP